MLIAVQVIVFKERKALSTLGTNIVFAVANGTFSWNTLQARTRLL